MWLAMLRSSCCTAVAAGVCGVAFRSGDAHSKQRCRPCVAMALFVRDCAYCRACLPCVWREVVRFFARFLVSFCESWSWSGDVVAMTRYRLRQGVLQCWQGVVSWELGLPMSASGMPTHRQKWVMSILCCKAALYVPWSCACSTLRRVRVHSEAGSPSAWRASGRAVGMSPSGTGVLAYVRVCRASRLLFSVRASLGEGTAVSGALMGVCVDGCHWNILAGVQKSHVIELVCRPHSRLTDWPLANHLGLFCWLLCPMPPRM